MISRERNLTLQTQKYVDYLLLFSAMLLYAFYVYIFIKHIPVATSCNIQQAHSFLSFFSSVNSRTDVSSPTKYLKWYNEV